MARKFGKKIVDGEVKEEEIETEETEETEGAEATQEQEEKKPDTPEIGPEPVKYSRSKRFIDHGGF